MRLTILLAVAILGYNSLAAAQLSTRWTFAPMIRGSTTTKAGRRGNARTNQPVFTTGSRNGVGVASAINDEILARKVVELALSIGRFSAEQNSGSEIFSPVSIMGVINLLLLGAGGNTRTELFRALKVNEMSNKEYHTPAADMIKNLMSKNPKALDQLQWKSETCTVEEDYSDEELDEPTTPKSTILHIANGLFTQQNLPVSSKYMRIANQLYQASSSKVNFQDPISSAATINKWAYQATKGKIQEITSGSFSPNTNMVIASSLYFKAFWKKEFLPKITKPKEFFPEGQGRPSVLVDMMVLIECLPYHFERSMGLRMIGLPYSDNSTTMYVLMPQNSTRDKIRNLQNQLTVTKIDTMISQMKLRTSTVSFPRMQLTSSTNLERSFRRLGVKSIFNSRTSDLQTMLESSSPNKERLFVSQISHKVNLSVDEQGTEGAAVTMTLIDRASSAVYFKANEPFLIYVRHDPTRLPLFYGAVFDPRG